MGAGVFTALPCAREFFAKRTGHTASKNLKTNFIITSCFLIRRQEVYERFEKRKIFFSPENCESSSCLQCFYRGIKQKPNWRDSGRDIPQSYNYSPLQSKYF